MLRARNLSALASLPLLTLMGLLVGSPVDASAVEVSAEAAAGDTVSLQTREPTSYGVQHLAIHGQATYGLQLTDGFHAPYAGPNSLSPASNRETVDLTLAIGVRLWSGAEIWGTPEIDQGFGLDNTLGVAGFPGGLAYKVGSNAPYFRLPRLFIRQTINEDGQRAPVEAMAGQLAGVQSRDRWVFTVGRFAVTDVFDTNRYAHDPRADFLNWAVIDTGTFDYAADAWGYTIGVAGERYIGAWAFRAGVFDLSDVPNSEVLEHGLHEFQLDSEIERRYSLFGQIGRTLLTVFDSRGRMALLDQATALAERTGLPDLAAIRHYRSRVGVSLGIEQSLSDNFGLFLRVGKAGGNVEAYEFSDIDRTVAIGGALEGTRWHRPADTVGLALLDNGISAAREQYLNAGGLGILVGDGKLPHPGAEKILEFYYSCSALSWLHLTLDYQWVKNPGYNTDRGPVSILGLRVHAQF